MKIHYFQFDVDPKPKQRPRVNTKTRRAYTPEATRNYERFIRDLTKLQWGKSKSIEKPIKMDIVFHMKRPASVPPRKRKYPSVRPDLDNLEKALIDAMQGIVFVDDSQIVTKTSSKVYGIEGRIEVKLRELR